MRHSAPFRRHISDLSWKQGWETERGFYYILSYLTTKKTYLSYNNNNNNNNKLLLPNWKTCKLKKIQLKSCHLKKKIFFNILKYFKKHFK